MTATNHWITTLAWAMGLCLTLSVCAPVHGAPENASSNASRQAERNASQADQGGEHGVSTTGGAEVGEGQSAHGSGHGESSGGLLSFDVGSYLWKIIIFTLFMIVLGKWVWPPILKGLQDREEKQRGDLRKAQTAANEANDKLEQYRQQLAEAQKESQRIIEQSRTEAKRLDAQQKEQTQAEIQSMRNRATSEIDAAKQQAIAEMYEQTAVVATQIAGRILHREINNEDHRDLVDRAVNDMPGASTSTSTSRN